MSAARDLGVTLPLAIFVVAGGGALLAALDDPRRALVGWIAAFGFATATVIGALVLVMVLYVTGARWWFGLRRVLLSVAGTAPLLVPLFIPVGAAFSLAYPWARAAEDGAEAAALDHQRLWNSAPFFLTRAVLYLGAWTTLAVLVRRGARIDAAADGMMDRSAEVRRQRVIGAVGLPVIGFTLTFASFDWLMSLQPGFVSNAFGLYVFTSGLVSALSVIVLAAWRASRTAEGAATDLHPDVVHAVGRLMLMAVILWAYIAFFQLLLVWIADLPHEVGFYVVRSRGGWVTVDVLLVVGRFVLPLVLLLSRSLKRSARALAAVAAWLLFTSVVDFAWLTLPGIAGGLAWRDLLPFVAFVAVFVAYGVHLFRRGTSAPAPSPDPMREESLRYRSP